MTEMRPPCRVSWREKCTEFGMDLEVKIVTGDFHLRRKITSLIASTVYALAFRRVSEVSRHQCNAGQHPCHLHLDH